MQRIAHYLRKARSCGFPGQTIALSVVCTSNDVSRLQRERTVKLLGWSAHAWREKKGQVVEYVWADGIDASSFWRWLDGRLKARESTWLWQLGACSGLTVLGFWRLLESREWRLAGVEHADDDKAATAKGKSGTGLCVINDPPTIVLACPGGKSASCRFVDIRNLGVGTWEEVCSDVQCSSVATATLRDGNATGRRVAQVRAETLATWLLDWYCAIRELKLGGLRPTAAAQAWNGWRSSYLNVPLLVHINAQALARERAALFGGRCECLRRSKVNSPVFQLDAAAHYPSVARDSQLPGRLCGSEDTDNAIRRRVDATRQLAIVSARIRTARASVPRQIGDITCWPVGEFNATLCWPEVKLAEKYGAEVELRHAWFYEPSDPWSGFIDRLWLERERAGAAGHKGRRSAAKRLLNCLIGKAAAVGRTWQDMPDAWHPIAFSAWEDNDLETGARRRWRSIGWRVQQEVIGGEHPESMPALAAWVYSVARCRLYEWMQVAGEENVYYVDTDSLWVSESGYARLLHAGEIGSGQLGRLRLVGCHKWAEFFGVKYYASDAGIVCAGLSDNSVITTDGGFEFWRQETVADSLRADRSPLPRLKGYRIPEQRPYRLGVTNPDGSVRPFRIFEEDCPAGEGKGHIIIEGE